MCYELAGLKLHNFLRRNVALIVSRWKAYSQARSQKFALRGAVLELETPLNDIDPDFDWLWSDWVGFSVQN